MPFGYYKAEPTEHVLVYQNGQIVREGAGISFFFWKHNTSIVSVPIATADVPFILNETTGNFQPVTAQGQITYRITDPGRMARILNFSIDSRTRSYRTDDPEKLAQRLVNTVQVFARQELLQRPLEDALRGAEDIASTVLKRIREERTLNDLGVEVAGLFLTAIKPTPETAKALEADFREKLLKRADEAIYARRAAAVEQEKKIKENELLTALTLARQRKDLVEADGANQRRQAEFEAEAARLRLSPYREIPQEQLVALALHEMGANAQKIGQLVVTPDLLSGLLKPK